MTQNTELADWYLSPKFPATTRIRRGVAVEIPEKWRGHIPMYPGELERRAQKKASKRALRRSEKLERRKIQDHEYE